MHRCPFSVSLALALAALASTCALVPAAEAGTAGSLPAPAVQRSDRKPGMGSASRPPQDGAAAPATRERKPPQAPAPKPTRIPRPKGAEREDAGPDVDDLLIDPSQLDDPARGERRRDASEEPAEPADGAPRESPAGPATGEPGDDDDEPAPPAPEPAGDPGPPEAAPPAGDGPRSSGPIEIRGLPPLPGAVEMAAWHRRYRQAVGPLKTALGAVVAADARERPEDVVPYCRRLGRALAAREVAELLPVPDLAVDLHWKHALGQLAATAEVCGAGSYARTAYHLHQAGQALAQMRLALRRWELQP